MDKQKILIVDHDLLVISELAGFLWDEPYEICLAGYGIEGLEILRQEKIDLAVVELHVEYRWYNAIEACEGGKNSDSYADHDEFAICRIGRTTDQGWRCKCI